MNAPIDLDQRMAQVARELGTRPELAKRVLAQAGDVPRRAAPRFRSSRGRAWRFTAAAATAALVAGAVWLAARPSSTAAQILRALGRVDTVHVTGTTHGVARRWPLEKPLPAAADTPQSVPVEAWYWTDSAGLPHSYESHGPVTLVRKGGDTWEYQQDADLLYVYENGYVKDRVGRFSQLDRLLAAIERRGSAKRELPPRREEGRTLAGLEITTRGEVRTLWWDTETLLPARMSIAETTPAGPPRETHLQFTYNEPVPVAVAGWKAPQAANVRYAGSGKAADAWREHVAALGRQLADEPLDRPAALLPRADGRLFSLAWTLPTPDGRYLVTPLAGMHEPSLGLFDCLRFQVAPRDASSRLHYWRVPSEFQNLPYCHDLVSRADVPWQQWVQVVLAQHGLEYVDVVENRTVWVARCPDPAKLPSEPVDPPVAYVVKNGVEQRGFVRCGVGMRLTPVTLKTLFEDFNDLQARDGDGTSTFIDDETGLPEPPAYDPARHGTHEDYWQKVVVPDYVTASDSPYFRGPDSLAMARRWYRDKLGITFTEETRPVTVHVVRRKSP